MAVSIAALVIVGADMASHKLPAIVVGSAVPYLRVTPVV